MPVIMHPTDEERKVLCYFHTSFQWKDMAQTLILLVFTAKHKRFSVPKQSKFMAFINFSGTAIQVVENLFRLYSVEAVCRQQFKEYGTCSRNSLQGLYVDTVVPAYTCLQILYGYII